MQNMTVATERIITALRRRIDELTYENVVLSAAVDQLQEQITTPGAVDG